MKNALQISPCSASKMGTSTKEINQNVKVQFFNYARNMHGIKLLGGTRQTLDYASSSSRRAKSTIVTFTHFPSDHVIKKFRN